jgi:phospholipid/cholesterol/gamma-HCH transport system substrate-binding protein
MLQKRRPDDTRRLLRLRHTDEWVGLLVVLALVLFFGAIFEAGVFKRWLNPDLRLHIVLPQSGFGGLAPGGDIEVLGTHAGTVDRIVLNPDGEMYAVATIERQTGSYIRRDSKASIRLRYGVAGAAYVEISRGKGPLMDWDYAVVTASVQPNPADTITETLNQVKAELLPTLDHAEHAMATLDQLIAGIKAGQGSAGRLLTDDTLIRQAEATVATLKGEITQLNPMLARVPPLLNQTHVILGNLQSVSRDAAHATPQLPAIARNLNETTSNLPALLTQAQASTEQLEKLLVQLRGWWLLGGNGAPKPDPLRLPPKAVRP